MEIYGILALIFALQGLGFWVWINHLESRIRELEHHAGSYERLGKDI